MAQGLARYLQQYQSGGPGGGSPAGGNPFAGIMSAMGGGGQGGVGASPAAPQRSGGGFNALLTPDAPGILGILGRLSGNPTREEWLFQKSGQAQQGGATKLSELLAQGVPPQQAVIDFMKTPEGMEFFTSVPNPSDEIKRIITNIVPEPEGVQQVAPGNALVTDSGDVRFRNQTTETQNFMDMAQIANLPKDQIEKLAAAKITEAQGDPTQTEAAINEMVKLGEITPEIGRKIRAGVLQFQPVLDATGQTTGHVIVDLTNPQAPQIIQPNNGRQNLPVAPGDPAYAPGVRDDGYDPDVSEEPGKLLSDLGDDPAGMVEGANIVAGIAEKAGGLASLFSPELANAGLISAKRRRALNQIKLDNRALRESGRYLKADNDLLDSVMPNTSGIGDSGVQTANELIQYNNFLDRRIAEATEVYNTAPVAKARGEAYEELVQLEKAKANVPSVESLRAKIQELGGRETSIMGDTIREGVNNVKKLLPEAGGAVREIEQGVENMTTPEFNDEKSIRDALLSGALKPGSRIMYKGKPYDIKMPANVRQGGAR